MTQKTCREVTLEIIEKCTRWLGNELSQLLLEHAERIDAMNKQLKALERPAEPVTVTEQKQSAVGDAAHQADPSQDTPTADYCIKTGPNGLPILPGGSIEKQKAAQITELRATNETLRNRLSEAETIANRKETINTELQAENERLKSDLNLSIFESEKNAISANNWQSSYRANKAMLTKVYKERDALKQRIAELEHLEAAAMLRESEAWRHVHELRVKVAGLESEARKTAQTFDDMMLAKNQTVNELKAKVSELESQAAELKRILETWEKMKKRNSIVAWSQNLYRDIDIEKLINPQPAKAEGE